MLARLQIFILFSFFILTTSLIHSQRLIRLGEEEIKNKNYIEAIKLLSDAIQRYPKIQNGYYLLAIAYRENNQLTESEGALLNGIAIGGDLDYKLYFELGNIMFHRGKGYYNLAIKYYSNSLLQEKNYDKALLNRANAYVERGKVNNEDKKYVAAWDDYSTAIHDYSQFITLRPDTEKKEDILYMIELLRNRKSELEKIDNSLKNRIEIIYRDSNKINNSPESENELDNDTGNNGAGNEEKEDQSLNTNSESEDMNNNSSYVIKPNPEGQNTEKIESKSDNNFNESNSGSDSKNNNNGSGDENNKINNKNVPKLNTNYIIDLEKINWEEELNIDE